MRGWYISRREEDRKGSQELGGRYPEVNTDEQASIDKPTNLLYSRFNKFISWLLQYYKHVDTTPLYINSYEFGGGV